MKRPIATLATTLVLSAAATHVPPAAAAEGTNATGACQGALPVYDDQFRKRPTSVRNEGTATAFISCSLPFNYAGNNIAVVAHLYNSSAVEVDVACTFVDGVAPVVDEATYYPQTITLPAGFVTSISWSAPDFGLPTFSQIANLSCALPPGVEIPLLAALN